MRVQKEAIAGALFRPGGVFGIGTPICAFPAGPAAGFFLPRSERPAAALPKKAD